jgi:GT2 family glycosyltransferase
VSSYALLLDEEAPFSLPAGSATGTITAADISVVVCAFNDARWEQLRECLNSLNVVGARQVVLVIDHNPRLLERARTEFPSATVVANVNANGLSGARNTGVAAADGCVMAFIDDDAVATADWLHELALGYQAPDVVAVGGHIEAIWQDGRGPRWMPDEFRWVVGCSYRGLPSEAAVVRNLIGCNMSFRREVFDQVGGFVTGLGRIGEVPVGCEETEFCIRVTERRPGVQIVYRPAARVGHNVAARRESIGYFLSRCLAEGKSKAQVAAVAGSRLGLGSERTYVRSTLPSGVAAGARDLFRGDGWGAVRAGAIVAGLLATTLGYLRGLVTERARLLAATDK